MSTSQNGWPASPTLLTRTIVAGGVTFRVADNRDAETVFTYVIDRYAATVEPLDPAQCGSFAYRPNVNDPSKLSNHSSATAVDLNSLKHRNGVATAASFTPAQIRACHAILASVPELSEVVHWGGDWFPPELVPDGMHWELHDHDLPKLARVADRIREADMPLNIDDKAWIQERLDAQRTRIVADLLAAVVDGAKFTVEHALERIGKAFDRNGRPRP